MLIHLTNYIISRDIGQKYCSIITHPIVINILACITIYNNIACQLPRLKMPN